MKNYTILYNKENIPIIIANTYISLSEVKDKIIKDLKKINYKGIIYFDNLLSNGNNFNRFSSACFDGKIFSNFKLVNKEIINKKFENILIDFYFLNYEKYVKNSNIISSALKFRIRKKLEI